MCPAALPLGATAVVESHKAGAMPQKDAVTSGNSEKSVDPPSIDAKEQSKPVINEIQVSRQNKESGIALRCRVRAKQQCFALTRHFT